MGNIKIRRGDFSTRLELVRAEVAAGFPNMTDDYSNDPLDFNRDFIKKIAGTGDWSFHKEIKDLSLRSTWEFTNFLEKKINDLSPWSRDYTGADIQMHVFDDRLEIWNEGELPVGYNQETLFARHSSKPRNRNIANAFFKAGFIDTWGRGFQKIRDGFEPAGIPMPTVDNFCGGVRVTIQRTKFMQMMNVTSNVTSNVSSDVVSSVGSLSVAQLSDRQKKIRELILKNTFVSAKQMSVVLSVVKRTVERDLADLQKKGVLIREGNTSAGHWIWVGAIEDDGNK